MKTPNLSPESKAAMLQGIKVRMHKADGSNSMLMMFFTPDFLEINCATTLQQPVKNKWKLAVTEINKIVHYHDEKQFKESVFFLAEGIFSKAPNMELCLSVISKKNAFHIQFESRSQLEVWKIYIEQSKIMGNQTLKKI